MAHLAKNTAIPMRAGVSPSCLALPRLRQPPWPTLLDHVAERLPAIGREDWAARFAAGEVLDEQGLPLAADAPYVGGARVYYWRTLAAEPPVPFEAVVLHADAHLVVADKPHFLPVTPGGRFVEQTLLVRLKRALGLADLSPLHRIDRETAGVVVFCVRAQDRDAYQRLFRERRIDKAYQAIAAAPPDGHALAQGQALTRRSHLHEDPAAFYRMVEATTDSGLAPNSETRIRCEEWRGAWARYRLEPISGKRHQLRVHMNALGLPLVGDQFYPRTRRGPDEAEDFAEPLGLLAQAIAFTDPVTGQARRFESQRTLSWPDAR